LPPRTCRGLFRKLSTSRLRVLETIPRVLAEDPPWVVPRNLPPGLPTAHGTRETRERPSLPPCGGEHELWRRAHVTVWEKPADR
jgi:hypothetical protein